MHEGIACTISAQDRLLINISSCRDIFDMSESSLSHSNGTASMPEPAQDNSVYFCDNCDQVG